MKEKEFLISLAVNKFNAQYNHNIRPENCSIKRIPTRKYHRYSFEILTQREDDYLKLHLHINLGKTDDVSPYRLEVDGSDRRNQLGDEVYVTSALVDDYYTDNGIYKFDRIQYSETNVADYLLTEGGDTIVTEDGQALELD